MNNCPICGKPLNEGEIFCQNCKALVLNDATDSRQFSKSEMTNFESSTMPKQEETWQEKFFTAEGRLNRQPYILRELFLGVMPYVFAFICGILVRPDVAENVALGLQILCAFPCVMLIIRRLHDIGRSGWWWLLALIPFVNFIFGIYLMCKKGEVGSNRFGAEPLQ